MRPSDSSRPFVISPFVLSDSRSSPSRSAEAERSPRVKTWNFPLHRRPYALPPTDIGLRLLTASSPKGRTPHDASLPFDAGFHLRLPPDLPSRARQGLSSGKDLVLQIDALVSSVLGSLRQGPMRTSTSCSTPMPGARFSRAPAALPETLRASAEGGQHGSGEPSIGFSRAPAALPETLRASAEGGQHGSGEPSIGFSRAPAALPLRIGTEFRIFGSGAAGRFRVPLIHFRLPRPRPSSASPARRPASPASGGGAPRSGPSPCGSCRAPA